MGGHMHFSDDLFVACVLLTSLFIVINAEDHKTEMESEHPFSYVENNANGPDHWGELDPEWKTCETGMLQSPIDLLNDKVNVLSTLGKLKKKFRAAPAVIKSRGHDITVEWKGDAGGININGTVYKLLQCHWHTPSEHTVQGRRFNMELHMIHESSEGDLAVIGILYKLGRHDTFLGKFLGHLDSISKEEEEEDEREEEEEDDDDEEEIDLGNVNPWEIKFGSRKYFRYMGSLTIPPCTEGVTWTVLNKVRTVSMEQIRALKKAVLDGFENNARPTQPRYGRSIYFYRPINP